MTAKPVAQKHMVITGGSKGIGLSIAKLFESEGYRIINLSRTPIPLADAVHIDIDLGVKGWVDMIAKPLIKAVDGSQSLVLVHNSAVQIPGSISDVVESDLRAMLEVNIVAPSLLNTVLIPYMPPGSSIVYVGSTMSLRATKNMTGYIASKHAVVGLMRSTCQDLAGSGIHTACVCPGFTKTEMLERYSRDMLSHLASMTTQERLIAPEEIARAIHFCAVNPVINGSVINADLGWKEY